MNSSQKATVDLSASIFSSFPARYPVSSSSSLAAQMLVSSSNESRFPAGTSRVNLSRAFLYWRTISILPSGRTARTQAAPILWLTKSHFSSLPLGSLTVSSYMSSIVPLCINSLFTLSIFFITNLFSKKAAG